jgi:8-oxo-dGTP diphosphatase
VGVGTAAFIFNNGECLLQKRQGTHGSSTWAPPGGKLDTGETPIQGIAREVFEETGLQLSLGTTAFIGYTNDIFEDEGLHYVTLWFTSISFSRNAVVREPHKCLEQHWTTIDTLPDTLFLPTVNILRDKSAYKQIQKTAQLSKVSGIQHTE